LYLAPGRTLSYYRLIEQIGEGGMGVVWRATDTALGRDAAIKFLPDSFSGDPERLARFEREAKLLASLSHPNIVTVYDPNTLALVRSVTLPSGNDYRGVALNTLQLYDVGTPQQAYGPDWQPLTAPYLKVQLGLAPDPETVELYASLVNRN
jgi:serine/threonine protein kinase